MDWLCRMWKPPSGAGTFDSKRNIPVDGRPPLPAARCLRRPPRHRQPAGRHPGRRRALQQPDAGPGYLAEPLETVFFLRPTAPGADYHIRIFTPTRELAFAGHPSVGAAWAAVTCGLAQPRAGLLQQCGRVAAGMGERPGRGTGDPAGQPAGGNWTRRQAERPPRCWRSLPTGRCELWDNGARWWLLPLRDADAVRSLLPDMAALAPGSLATDATGLAVFADEAGTGHTRVVRAFCPADAPAVPEDP